MMVLPTLMIIIVNVTIIPKYNDVVVRFNHVGFLLGRNSTFDSVKGIVRIEKDYISASKDFSSSDLKIILKRAAKSVPDYHR